MLKSICYSFLYCSSDISSKMVHPFSTPWGRRIERNVPKQVMRSVNPEVLWNDNDDVLPKSFSGLKQLYSDRTATSLKRNSLIAYPFYAVQLNITAEQKMCFIEDGCTLLVFLLVKSLEVKMELKAEI